MNTQLEEFNSQSDVEDMLGALERDGVAAIRDVIDPALIQRIDDDLAPYLATDRARLRRELAAGAARVGAVLAKTLAIVPILQSDLLHNIATRFLLPHCASYQLSAIHLIEVQPGSAQGTIHRDDVIWPMPWPRPVAVINFLIPMTDFTTENGGTLVVPGSHRWARDPDKIGPGRLDLDAVDPVRPEQLVTTDMACGAVLPLLGGVLHCSGANRTDQPRRALSISLMLGWLRQEENFYLTVPRERLDRLPQDVLQLIGYRIHHPYLGHTGFE
ncbi:MAG: phytanoyl-CoA dioxygenase family protein [Paracoccaceae bacterium]|nr:phytanoyl-CoA dioxygenase family protein [Paracoccaceae bacterium]